MKPVKLNGKDVLPSKIVCIGRNYVEHIKELGNEVPAEPVIFLKPNSSISPVIQAGNGEEIHFEGEITFMVRGGQLAAVGFGLDLTKRNLQTALKNKGLPWERAKAFDGAAVFSDMVELPGDITGLRLELHINGQLVQHGSYDLMMHKPDEILAVTKQFLSYEDGDLIMTGTPKGVGKLTAGDRFNGKIFEQDKLLVEGHWLVR
jgi:2-keto-4-pentenoate hydratase/2-oxohepta-3-ene-1,7-dioic acid hydratase in catechol pathway